MTPNDIYNETITILNKYPRVDNGTSLDIWYQTVITNASVHTTSVSTMVGTSVQIGEKHTVLVPFNDNYYTYSTWKDLVDKTDSFTASQGDYIIKGTITETVTSSNVIETIKKYNAIQVKSIMEAKDRGIVNVQLKLEGV